MQDLEELKEIEIKQYPLYHVLCQLLSLSRPRDEYAMCIIEAEESEVFNHYEDQMEELIARCENAEKEQVVDVKQLIADYEACPDDGDFEPPHPIFLMAQQIDNLKKELKELYEYPVSESNAEKVEIPENIQFKIISDHTRENDAHRGYCDGWNDCIEAYKNANS